MFRIRITSIELPVTQLLTPLSFFLSLSLRTCIHAISLIIICYVCSHYHLTLVPVYNYYIKYSPFKQSLDRCLLPTAKMATVRSPRPLLASSSPAGSSPPKAMLQLHQSLISRAQTPYVAICVMIIKLSPKFV